ncbi:hypothetical protein LX16_4759 [Stackebrandtia albiflava]|uniref:ATPase n=1 Tax=Stackebrandtia albiflava TaxID=406432 RepID=A0A562UQU7_9ACTN|nr:ATP-binding protein [Stackebrandtia albiflava]TWJ07976.1 hypothetical protein LX16_4759 [Stackebrandtia albiflava]
MRKPDRVIGRDHEWRVLERFMRPTDDPGLRIGIVSGRRRVGKTFLLTAVEGETGGLYHACVQDEGDLAARRRFAASIARYAGGTPVRHDDHDGWEELLRTALAVAARVAPAGTRPVLIIDEFPYAMANAPQLPGILQLLYDEAQRDGTSSGNIILCGSSLSVMRELLSGTKPLRGRATIDLRLRPLDYRETGRLWGIDDAQTMLHVHACIGGYPGYRRLIDERPSGFADFDRWICDTMLSVGMGVFTSTEVDYLLREDPRISDKAIYYDILGAIADGRVSLSKIGAATGRTKESVRKPIETLQSGGYVTSITDLINHRDTVTVADPIIRFDRLITAPHLGQLELGRQEQVWKAAAPSFRSQILGPHFEEIAREWLRRFAPDELGRPNGFGDIGTANIPDHKGRAKHEVDVLAVRGKNIEFIGEAKATLRAQGTSTVERLSLLLRLLADMGYRTDGAVIAVFSRTGFTPDLTTLARERADIELVDLDRLFHGRPASTAR